MKVKVMFGVGDRVGYPDLMNTERGRSMTVLDREYLRFKKTGKTFIRYLCDGLLERLAEDIRSNVENEYDNLICIEGREGTGKSNLAVALCRAIDPDWDMQENYIYNYGEFVEAITSDKTDDRRRVFFLDEGSLVANKRESMSEDSKRFVELLETMRSRGWTLVMCIPSAERLDIYIREHRMRYLLRAWEKSWDVVYTESARGYFELLTRKGYGLDRFKTVAYGRFPKMSPEDEKVYRKLKEASQVRLMDKIAGKNQAPKVNKNNKVLEKQRHRIENSAVQLQKMGMKISEISAVLGCDDQMTKEYLHDGKERLAKEGVGSE